MSDQLQQLLCQLPYFSSPVKGGLTALTVVVVLSLVFFIWKKPGRATPPPSDFAVIRPRAGDTVTKRSIIPEGVGIRPDLSYAMSVNVISDIGVTTYKHGDNSTLEVDADCAWRFKFIHFESSGQYELIFNAVLDGKRISRKFHVNVTV